MQRNPLNRTSSSRGVGLLIRGLLAATWLLAGSAGAGVDPLARVQAQLVAAQQALTSKDFAGAEKQLISAYLKNPHPHLLCWFGRWAARLPATTTQRPLPHDYFRRCLDTSPPPEDAELVAEARATLARPLGPDEQVELQVLASGDEMLWVDDHLVGKFPLARPLLLSPGQHLLRRARAGEAPLQREISLSPDQPIYVTSMQGGWDVSFMDLFLVLLAEPATPAPLERAALWRLLEAALERDNALAVSHRRARRALSSDQHLPGCAGLPACLADVGTVSRVPYVLEVSLASPSEPGGKPRSLRLALTAYDVRAEEVSHTQVQDCTDCDSATLERRLSDLVRQARKAVMRPLAVLEIRSTPLAQLAVDGRPRGSTPRTVALPPGRHNLLFQHPYFFDRELPVELAEGSRPPLVFALAPRPLTSGEKFLRAGGWTFAAVGLAAVLAGVAPFVVDGQAVPQTNPLEVLATRDVGVGLMIGGGIALTGGVVMIAIDRSRPLRRTAPWK